MADREPDGELDDEIDDAGPEIEVLEMDEWIEDNKRHYIDDEDVAEELAKKSRDVAKGFEDQQERAESLQSYWDIYNCKLGEQQSYTGTSRTFIPLVFNAVNARKTRFTNQIFPQSKRHVEVLSTDGTQPDAALAILEHYIDETRLRTEIMPAMCKAGDIEGQYSLYVGWSTTERKVYKRVKMPLDPKTGAASDPKKDFLEVEKIVDGKPFVEVISDSDLFIFPATADSIEDALLKGGGAALIRRYSKAKLKKLVKDGTLDEEATESLVEHMEDVASKINRPNRKKKQLDSLGIKGGGKEAEIYEMWINVEIDGEECLCQAFARSDGKLLGCRKSPYWNGKVPVVSASLEKVGGTFKGESKVKFCAQMQYYANDAINIAMDSAIFSLQPIVMTDPERNPRIASMVLNMAAIWEVSPEHTKFVQFPELWRQGFELVSSAKAEVMQVMSVSPAAITQTGNKRKTGQAELANEQQVDILTTADAVTVIENGILTPLVNWFFDLDYQYRDRAIFIKKLGQLGVLASMEEIPPLQVEGRYSFKWFGVEAARNAAAVQQQIAAMNVLRGIPPQSYPGHVLDLTPIITQTVESTFGPRLAHLIFKPIKETMSMPPEQENDLLTSGFRIPVGPQDDDQAHIQSHQVAVMLDTSGEVKAHIMLHVKALNEKQMAKAPKGVPGTPAPGQPGAGAQGQGPNQPTPGAMPMRLPVGGQSPAGSIPADQANLGRAGREPRGG